VSDARTNLKQSNSCEAGATVAVASVALAMQ
jgi:hypothetical protein